MSRKMNKSKSKSKKSRTNKNIYGTHLNLKLIAEMFKKELDTLNKLNSEQLIKIETNVNAIEKQEGEDLILNGLSNFFNSENMRLSLEQINEISEEFVPKRNNSINRCLEQYSNVEEIKNPDHYEHDNMNRHYSAIKNGKKYFITVKSLDTMREYLFKKIKKELKLYKKASPLKVVSELYEVFYCRDNDGSNKLFIIKEFIEGTPLDVYMTESKLTEKDKQNIKSLIDKCFNNDIILSWILPNMIIVKKVNGVNTFILTSLLEASDLNEIINEKKEDAQRELGWIEQKSEAKNKKLAIKKLLRESKVTFSI
jgi:hypothetical protein